MRNKNRKWDWRQRTSACLLALALLLVFTCGQQTPVRAATGSYLALTVAGGGAVPLEIGDMVSLDLEFTADAASITDAYEVHALWEFEHPDCFEIVSAVPENGWNAVSTDYYVDVTSRDGSGRAATGKIATITFRVRKAVENTTTIKLTTIKINRMDSSIDDGTNATCTLTNSMAGSRNVNFAMQSTVQVPLDSSDKVKVPIKITVNSGFNAVHLTVQYLPTLLNYEGWEMSDVARNARVSLQTAAVTASTTQSGWNELSLCFVALNDVALQGDFILVEFSANIAGATQGATTNINTKIIEVSNESGTTITYNNSATTSVTFMNGTQQRLGDVNDDGVVNLIDATWALQAYNGVRVLTDEQAKRADVNRSGSLTLVDVLLIMKFYNGEITQFPGVST